MTAPASLFLVTAPGLEALLADEARALRFDVTGTVPGGVAIAGGWQDAARANLELRGAVRVLARVAEFRAFHLAQLDKRSKKLPWGDWLPDGTPVRVDAVCRKSKIYHDRAAAQRVKDAARAALGPVADRPEVTVKLRIEDDLCTVSLDTTGASLHKRGLKVQVNKAPMRETLAALFLRACGYDGSQPVYDPMCGSGTFVIEAAEIAGGLQPGRVRDFAAEGFVGGAAMFEGLRRTGADMTGPVRFHGSDRDTGAVRMAAANAERAGLSQACSFTHAPIADIRPPDGPAGLIIANPPYGGRIGKAGPLHGLYGAFGAVLKDRFAGWKVGVVTADAGLAKSMDLAFDPPGPVVDHGGTKVRLWQTRL